MANIASAAKRARQSTRITERNRTLKTKVKTLRKNVLDAIEAGDKSAAASSLNTFNSAMDKASKSSAVHRNSAARSKSTLAKQVSAI